MRRTISLPNYPSLRFRAICAKDKDTLAEIYASTRREEVAPIMDWTDQQKEAFLRDQFELQHKYYINAYPNAAFDLVMAGEGVLGRLYVDRRAGEIRIIDIALLPQYRGQGIGGAILESLLDEAASRDQGRVVRIHVEHMNPAMRLYVRLGFYQIEDKGIYKLMEWRP
jgi:ribosomal protein S18 acetylase RimI-like enzyme